MRRLAALVLLAVAGVTGGAVAAPGDPDTVASGVLVTVTVPGEAAVSSGTIVAPPTADLSTPFLHPEDGSVVRIGSGTTRVAAQPGRSSSAQTVITGLALSLLGGEIAVESFAVRVLAAAGPAGASADGSSSTITGLTVLGAPVATTPGEVLPVADWGELTVLAVDVQSDPDTRAARAEVTGLLLRLLVEHNGLPAGTEIAIGTAAASAAAGAEERPAAPKPRPKPQPTPAPAPQRPRDAPQQPGASVPGAPPQLVRPAPEVTARLTDGGYVFPVFGPASFGDTFGAPRRNLESGWHHGEDIVAPLGTPILAVADGTVFSVGWNELGGWKLWLRDAAGNEFYYAHLSAYSPLAVDGSGVRAGDVLGFMGDTGDSRGSPHLHFEIHPVALLSLGYDGVVAPYPFLVAWRRAEDVSFDAGRRFAGIVGGRGLAPPGGAVLLEIDDISGTSGLVPGALERAVAPRREDPAALLRTRS